MFRIALAAQLFAVILLAIIGSPAHGRVSHDGAAAGKPGSLAPFASATAPARDARGLNFQSR